MSTAPELIAAMQAAHLKVLSTFSEKQAVQVALVTAKVEREILHQWDRMTDFSKARAITLLEETRSITAGAKTLITEDMAKMLGKVSAESAATHSKILSFGGKAAAVQDVALSPEQMAAYWKRTPVGGHLLKDWVSKSFDEPTIDRIQREIATGMFKGESYAALGKRLKEGFGMTRAQIDTLTRTYVHTANIEALKATYAANKDIIQALRWTAAKQPNTCLICISLDGKEFPLEATSPCPQHPRCRCGLTPVTSFNKLGLSSQTANDHVQSEGVKKHQLPDLSETVSEWLRKQSPETQTKVLGPKRFSLLEAGVIAFSDLVDMTDVNNPRIRPIAELLNGKSDKEALKTAKAPARQPTMAELQSRLDFASWTLLEGLAMNRMSKAEQRRRIEAVNQLEAKMGRKQSSIRDFQRIVRGEA